MDMFDKIKSMDRQEMARFIAGIYYAGQYDAKKGLCDDGPDTVFGGALLNYDAEKYFRLWNECYGGEEK